jgi:hypothetical protein
MASELHQESLLVLSEIRTLSPDVRLGQLFDFPPAAAPATAMV